MARNFWFDAFAADKAEKVSLPPITKAERIANLRGGIERFRNRIEVATSASERDHLQDGLNVRLVNLSRLLAA